MSVFFFHLQQQQQQQHSAAASHTAKSIIYKALVYSLELEPSFVSEKVYIQRVCGMLAACTGPL